MFATLLPSIPEPQRSPAAYALLEKFKMYAQTKECTYIIISAIRISFVKKINLLSVLVIVVFVHKRFISGDYVWTLSCFFLLYFSSFKFSQLTRACNSYFAVSLFLTISIMLHLASYSVESSPPGTMKDSHCEVVRLRSFAEWPRNNQGFYATPQKVTARSSTSPLFAKCCDRY